MNVAPAIGQASFPGASVRIRYMPGAAFQSAAAAAAWNALALGATKLPSRFLTSA